MEDEKRFVSTEEVTTVTFPNFADENVPTITVFNRDLDISLGALKEVGLESLEQIEFGNMLRGAFDTEKGVFDFSSFSKEKREAIAYFLLACKEEDLDSNVNVIIVSYVLNLVVVGMSTKLGIKLISGEIDISEDLDFVVSTIVVDTLAVILTRAFIKMQKRIKKANIRINTIIDFATKIEK